MSSNIQDRGRSVDTFSAGRNGSAPASFDALFDQIFDRFDRLDDRLAALEARIDIGPPKRYLTTPEAVAYLSMKPSSFRNACLKYGVPRVEIDSRPKYDIVDLDALASQCKTVGDGAEVAA